ncbi:MAG TPA: stage V sporulation protein D [Ruminococcaceae bacterium]|nr:stage V sporulation protein D [Oscillospiraceae bacterium]
MAYVSKSPTKKMWRRIFCILMVMVLAAFGTISGRLVDIMVVEGEWYKQQALDQQLRDTSLTAMRGDILDTNLNILATSASVWTVFVTPNSVKENQKALIADGLSEILGIDREKIMEQVEKKTGYEIIQRKTEQSVADELRKYIRDNDLQSVVGLDESSKRYYPNDNLASTVLGFVGYDNQGLAGIEAYYEELLGGVPGRKVTAKNARGSDMPSSYEKIIDAQKGTTLVLTIDEHMQYFAEKHLEQAIIDNEVTSKGAVIVMDVNTGGILAMATKPDFNPNEPFIIYDTKQRAAVDALTGKEREEALYEAQQSQWRNKAVSDLYEPGSVYKIITAAMALDENKVSLSDNFHCSGNITIAGTVYHCHKTIGHGPQTFQESFMNSCNPAFIQIGQNVGIDTFQKYFGAFGLTQKTGIDLPGETDPLSHAKGAMGIIELASSSFGQTFKVSPIQLITAASAAVNGGYLVQPHVLKQTMDSDGNVLETVPTMRKQQVISQETSLIMREMMENVVSLGGGKNAYIPGYRIGGKTGTSQKMDQNNEKARIASFLGMAPADDPQIAVLLMLDEPHGTNIYGGTIAAPVAGKIMNDILDYMGVERKYTAEELAEMDINAPDTVGKEVQESRRMIENAGLSVRVVGDGAQVERQVPAYDQPVPRAGTVVLYTDAEAERETASVPDFTGMTLSQVNSAAAEMGLNVKFSGVSLETSGARAITQSIPGGETVEWGTVVTVEFRFQDTVE